MPTFEDLTAEDYEHGAVWTDPDGSTMRLVGRRLPGDHTPGTIIREWEPDPEGLPPRAPMRVAEEDPTPVKRWVPLFVG